MKSVKATATLNDARGCTQVSSVPQQSISVMTCFKVCVVQGPFFHPAYMTVLRVSVAADTCKVVI